MRLSEFRRAVATEFGEVYGKSLCKDLALERFGSKSADEALEAGADPRAVWLELCQMQGVPETRQYGVGRKPKTAS